MYEKTDVLAEIFTFSSIDNVKCQKLCYVKFILPCSSNFEQLVADPCDHQLTQVKLEDGHDVVICVPAGPVAKTVVVFSCC